MHVQTRSDISKTVETMVKLLLSANKKSYMSHQRMKEGPRMAVSLIFT